MSPAATAIRQTRRFTVIVFALTGLFMSVLMWQGEKDSCNRQGPVREASNARKRVVDRLAVETEQTMRERGQVAQADALARDRRAIPVLPTLDCGGLIPDAK